MSETVETTTAVEPKASEVRAWARDNGYVVGQRGTLSADVKAAYAAAHQG